MSRTDKNIIKIVSAVFALSALAAFFHYVSVSINSGAYPFIDKLMTNIRTFIYIGIFFIWGVSVNARVIQKRVKLQLLLVDALMLFWLIVREFKFRYVTNPDVLRYLWYMYYIPILLIPLFALLVSLSLGLPENRKLPGFTLVFCSVTLILIVLMLTNDLHQLAFDFPENAGVWNEFDYKYGILYYVVVSWAAVCSLFALAVMLRKQRVSGLKRYIAIPLIPFVFSIVYIALYSLRLPIIINHFGDLSVVFCLVFSGFFEGCIQIGLIQSNMLYSKLFNAMTNMPVQILDNDNNIKFSTKIKTDIPTDLIEKAKNEPVIIDEKYQLHTITVNGGAAVWNEDVSELLSLRKSLKESSEELKERNALLELEYKKESEHRAVEEQNRLYDLLQQKTQSRLDNIDRLMLAYKTAVTAEEKQRLLARIVILGTYIKRSKDFVLSMEYASSFPELMLSSALAESCRALKLCGIKGSYIVNTGRAEISGGILSEAYDFFEEVIEEVLSNALYVNVRFFEVSGKLRMSILSDCEQISGRIKLSFPEAEIISEDGLEFLLSFEGGADDD